MNSCIYAVVIQPFVQDVYTNLVNILYDMQNVHVATGYTQMLYESFECNVWFSQIRWHIFTRVFCMSISLFYFVVICNNSKLLVCIMMLLILLFCCWFRSNVLVVPIEVIPVHSWILMKVMASSNWTRTSH